MSMPPMRRHRLRPLDARQRRRHAVPAADAARPRRGQREQRLPDLDVSQRIHAGDHPGERPHQVADQLLRATGDLAVADQPLVGAHLDQHDLVALHPLMRSPARLVVGHRQGVRQDLGDFHAPRVLQQRLPGCISPRQAIIDLQHSGGIRCPPARRASARAPGRLGRAAAADPVRRRPVGAVLQQRRADPGRHSVLLLVPASLDHPRRGDHRHRLPARALRGA